MRTSDNMEQICIKFLKTKAIFRSGEMSKIDRNRESIKVLINKNFAVIEIPLSFILTVISPPRIF